MKLLFHFFLLIVVLESFIVPVNPQEQKNERRQEAYYRRHKIQTEFTTLFTPQGDTLEKEGYRTISRIDQKGHVMSRSEYSPLGVSTQTTKIYFGNRLTMFNYRDYRRVTDTVENTYTMTYDSTGRAISETEHLPTGDAKQLWNYKYDAQDRVVEASLGHSARDGFYGDTWKFSYDSAGNVASEEAFDVEGNVFRTTYRYDKNKYVTEIARYRGTMLLSKELFTYNTLSQLTEMKKLNTREVQVIRDVYKYNTSGLLVEVEQYGSGEQLQSVRRYTYHFYK
jgi:hypothetical protein